MKTCRLESCGKDFNPRTPNTEYCTPECQRKSALERYYKNKERRITKRTCEIKSCTTILSTYNKEEICEAHKTERFILRLVEWGWDEEAVRKELE